jgi:hypothetical protein
MRKKNLQYPFSKMVYLWFLREVAVRGVGLVKPGNKKLVRHKAGRFEN